MMMSRQPQALGTRSGRGRHAQVLFALGPRPRLRRFANSARMRRPMLHPSWVTTVGYRVDGMARRRLRFERRQLGRPGRCRASGRFPTSEGSRDSRAVTMVRRPRQRPLAAVIPPRLAMGCPREPTIPWST